ncbi:hypothetical protein HBB16_12010 [Pseudonocardia sp. MCCB 268]|nr:hypothetical protein [Pseudonocardia cytotoxica]
MDDLSFESSRAGVRLLGRTVPAERPRWASQPPGSMPTSGTAQVAGLLCGRTPSPSAPKLMISSHGEAGSLDRSARGSGTTSSSALPRCRPGRAEQSAPTSSWGAWADQQGEPSQTTVRRAQAQRVMIAGRSCTGRGAVRDEPSTGLDRRRGCSYTTRSAGCATGITVDPHH